MLNLTTPTPGESTSEFDVSTDAGALSNVTDSNTEYNERDLYTWIFFIHVGYGYWIWTVLISITGLAGNAMVFVLLRDVKFSLLSYPVYLRFLAVSDSVLLITSCIQYSLRFNYSFYVIMIDITVCNLWRCIRYTVALLSPWLVVGLNLDRFYCVVFPMKRDRFCTKRKATIICSCLIAVSVAMSIPLAYNGKVVKGADIICIVSDELMGYFASLRLVFNSTLPCLLMLILNIVIGIHIQRSVSFRKRFTSTSSGSKENKLDKSLLPLMLISILAFVTLLPSSITESVFLVLIVTRKDPNALHIFTKLWPPFNIVYLINFGQNFYILMASSANYRKMMKKKLKCKKVSRQKVTVSVSRDPVQDCDVVDFNTNVEKSSGRQSLKPGPTSSVTSFTMDCLDGSTDFTEMLHL
ncbi:proteinase-activated receptor 1-like [Gigantopelta aegis]|uniref:proteinase-activated receptor 1-like n=1 Tax=Gigantopelta aegis TaxID=1735272 RepID=UPI001B88BC22|nr:proteinase-activated receptor 1-like [Gigantopelta aegis]